MKALVTGATGFLGSYLTRLLVSEGHEVAVLRREGTEPWRIAHLLDRVTSMVCDLDHLRDAAVPIERFAPDTVFHVGWYGVGSSHRNEMEQIGRNLDSSVALLRMASQAGCRTFIGLGSQAEYGPQNRMLDETAPTQPTTTYGVAKLCAQQIGTHLARQMGMRFAWLRVFSLYGPGDTPEFMLPSLIRKLLDGQRPSLTAGEQRWDYLYVEDGAEAIYRVAQTEGAEGIFNLGSGQVQTLRRIVEQIRDAIDPALPLGFGEVPYRPDQVMHLQADIRRLSEATGWKPRTSFPEGLARTVQWYRSQGGAA